MRNPPCRARTEPGELRKSGWIAVLFITCGRAWGTQQLHWLQTSALFLHCASICEYHILFLSCTVLFETLAKRCTGEAAESWLRWSSVISIKNILSLATCYRCGNKSTAVTRGFFLLKNISLKLQNGENHLCTYTNNFCSSYTRALAQSPYSGKTANFVETNSTVLIS